MSLHNTLHAFYDLRVATLSFGVTDFLVSAEEARRDKGLEDIHVVIVKPSNLISLSSVGGDMDVDQGRWRMTNVIVPCCYLLPSVKNMTVCDNDGLAKLIFNSARKNVFPKNYTLEQPIEHTHQGFRFMAGQLGRSCQFVEASPQARQYARQWLNTRANGRRSVPITLRESNIRPERNSDLRVWAEIAQRLQSAGYFPFIIRDIDKACEALPLEFKEIHSCPEAAFSLELRTALYEESHICAFVPTGPASLGYFNRNIKYLVYQTGDWLNGDPPANVKLGLGFGKTPAYANHFQKWIFKEQNADTFMDEFHAMDDHIEKSWADGSYEAKLDPNIENREPMEVVAERVFSNSRSYPPVAHEYVLQLLKYCSPSLMEKFDTQIALAEIYLQRQELEKSKSHYLKAAEAPGSTEPWPLVQLGMICELQSHDDEAMKYYEQAIEIDDPMEASYPIPSSTVHYRMGALTQKKGEMTNATEHFQLSKKIGETDQQVFAKLDALLERLKQLDKLDQPALASHCCRLALSLWRRLNVDVAR